MKRRCDLIVSYRQSPGPAAVFERLPKLRAFLPRHRHPSIDVPAASKAGVLVTQASAGFVTSVTELVLGFLVDLSRGVARHALLPRGQGAEAIWARAQRRHDRCDRLGRSARSRAGLQGVGMKVLVNDHQKGRKVPSTSCFPIRLRRAARRGREETENLIGEPPRNEERRLPDQRLAQQPGRKPRSKRPSTPASLPASPWTWAARPTRCRRAARRAQDVLATPHTAGLAAGDRHQSWRPRRRRPKSGREGARKGRSTRNNGQGSHEMKTVLITGATGDVGTHLSRELAGKYKLRLSDKRPMKAPKGQSFGKADISRMADALKITKGVDAIVHLGGYSVEGPWEGILQANIIGGYNIFEAARNGVKRMSFRPATMRSASTAATSHRPRVYPRPDSRYGVSKVFGEALGRLYTDKYGMRFRDPHRQREPKPTISGAFIWISLRDIAQLVSIGIDKPGIKLEIVYGIRATRAPGTTNERLPPRLPAAGQRRNFAGDSPGNPGMRPPSCIRAGCSASGSAQPPRRQETKAKGKKK
jgi:uronate dehydrogenase